MTTTPKDHRAVIKQLVEATDIAAPYFTHNALFAQALTAGREALGADDSGFVINNTRNQVSSVQLHQLKEGLAVGRDGPVSPPSGLAQEDGTTPELDQMRGKPRPSQLAAQQLGGEAA